MKYFALLGVMLFVAACGSKSDHGTFVDPGSGGGLNRGGGSGTAGSAGKGGATGGSGGAGETELAPAIEITTPTAADNPNSDSVLIDAQVTVLCTAKSSAVSGAKAVDPSTVKIEMLDGDGKSLKLSPGAPTENDNEYAAAFVLSELPSGAVNFRCSASDSATPPNTGSYMIGTLIDHGPQIMATDPIDKSAHNLVGPMNVEFSTAAEPIATGDKQAGVTGVTLTIGGTKIPTHDNGDGTYKASVDFTDKSLFDAVPSGVVPILITATNGRKVPGKATATLAYNIVVDGVGPAITLSSPAVGAVVGRASLLTFTITDQGSSVDRSTIQVKLNEATRTFSSTDGLWTADTAGAYTFKIGSALITNTSDTQVTVNVLAKDLAGNASMGNSRIFHLDNKPPVVDLDPADVFETRPVTGGFQCSGVFDPLGTEPPNDKETIDKFGTFRALVQDETNDDGQQHFFYAMTNRDSVRLYVQADTQFPLLADRDKDGVCDEIWTGSIPFQYMPTDTPLPFLALKPIDPTGQPKWGAGSTLPLGVACLDGPDSAAGILCSPNSTPGSDMTVVIRHPAGNSPPFEPVIYAIDPNAVTSAPLCTGDEWKIASAISSNPNQLKLGWVCIAARAEDAVGNPGISPPLRICVDDGSNPHRCDNLPIPTCTDNCTAPPHFAGGIVRHN